MSLYVNCNFNETIPNVNINGSMTAANSNITNDSVSFSTIGSALVTSNFTAVNNTIGNIFTTGGNIGVGTTSPSNLLSINGTAAITNLLGNTTSQVTNDTLFVGNSSSNFFMDRNASGGALIFGYNTPKPSVGGGVFQVYNNSTDRIQLLSVNTAGVSSGNNSIYIGTGFSNVPAFSYTGGATVATGASMLTGGSTVIDTRSGFNASTGRYTIPITGYYQYSYTVRFSDGTPSYAVTPQYIRSGTIYKLFDNWIGSDGTVNNRRCGSYSDLLQFNAGDEVYLALYSNSGNFGFLDFCVFLVTVS